MRTVWIGLLVVASGCAANRPSFQALETGVSVSLRGLAVVDEDCVWASGAAGTVIRSVDGGKTWRRFTVDPALDLRSLHAFDRERAVWISAGQPACVVVTEDGGATFERVWQSDHDDAFFDAVAFWDERNGLAFSDPVGGAFYVTSTDDGGRSWWRVPSSTLPEPLPGEAGFAASGSGVRTQGAMHAWIATGGGPVARVLRTVDRGRSWSVSTAPIRAAEPAAGIFSLAVSGDRVVVVGGNYQRADDREAVAAFSSDGGETFVSSSIQPGGYRSGVEFFGSDGRRLLAVGRNGVDLSRDGGATWESVHDAAFQAVRAAPGGRVGYAVGARGVAVRIEF